MLVNDDIAGQSSTEKANELRKQMKKKDVEWLVITALDDVACK